MARYRPIDSRRYLITTILTVIGLVFYFGFLLILLNTFAALSAPVILLELCHLIFFTEHAWLYKMKIGAGLITINYLIASICCGFFFVVLEAPWKRFAEGSTLFLNLNRDTVGIAAGVCLMSAISLAIYMKTLKHL